MATTAPRHPWQPKTWAGKAGTRLRRERILPYLTGRKVLDLGAATGYTKPTYLHLEVVKVAGQAVGLDLDPERTAGANERWQTDIRLGDAQSFDLGETFDVIHAGELIEHLDNPGGLLASCAKHLEPGGRIVVTTPNPFAFSNFVYRIGAAPKVNAEHVAWYDEDVLRHLLERFGFHVVEVDYVPHETPGRWRGLVARSLRKVLPRRLRWNTLLVVAERT